MLMNNIRKTILWMLLLPMVQVMAITDQQVVQTALTLHQQGMT